MNGAGDGIGEPGDRGGAGLTAESGWQGAESPFPAIADYGFLSDCQCNALVAPSGAVEWMCVPRPDSPSVFAAILDRGPWGGDVPAGTGGGDGAGVAAVSSGTLALETTWKTRTGWLSVRDALLVGRWHLASPSPEWRRTPGDFAAGHCLVRTACCLSGAVPLELFCAPAFGYGRDPGRWAYMNGDYGHGRCAAEDGGLELELRTDMRLGFEAWGAPAARCAKARRSSRRCRGRHSRARQPPRRRHWNGCGARVSSGASGWGRGSSPTTGGRRTCSKAR